MPSFILRAWRKEDAPAIARHANNEKIAANLRDVFPSPYTLQDAEQFIVSCLQADEEEQLCRVIERDGQAIGSVCLTRGTDVYRKSAEIGYWLAEPFWNRGIMSRAIKQCCAQAFDRWDIVRIYAEPYAYNIASQRALQKAGFQYEGRCRKSVYKNGQIKDSCLYALLREELNKRAD